MSSDSQENKYRRIAIVIASRCVAVFIVLSFLATLLPAGTAAAQSIMACCKGQAAGHCHANIKWKKAASISNPCHSECCASSAPAQLQKRQHAIAQPAAKLVVPFVVFRHTFITTPLLALVSEWNPVSPRGPPSFFVAQIS